MKIIFNYWVTVVNLRPIQIYFRIYYYISRKLGLNFAISPTSKRVSLSRNLNLFIPESSKKYFVSEHELIIHGRIIDLNRSEQWHQDYYPLLSLYHLHYFDYLMELRTATQQEQAIELILRWINDYPVGSSIAWDPYPTSLRIFNWIKFLQSADHIKPSDQRKILRSIVVQTDYLSRNLEYHLLGNHLFANAKTLFVASVLLGDEYLLARSISILERELREQILSDGGHFERSPSYHAIILQDCLEIYSIAINLKQLHDFNKQLRLCIERALNFYLQTLHQDMEIAFLNDSNFSNCLNSSQVIDYAQRFGFLNYKLTSHSILFNYSGVGILATSTAKIIADVGSVAPDYLPAHAHAETLSFELSVFGSRIIINSGIGEYGQSAERLRQRGTAAHSTVRIDGRNSSEVWGGFRMGRRARAMARLDPATNLLVASHDGYRQRTVFGRLRGIRHHRRWQMMAERLVIIDRLSAIGSEKPGRHRVEIFYHLHPNWQVQTMDSNSFLIAKGDHSVKFFGDSRLAWRICASTYHPEFGSSIPNLCLVGEAMVELDSDLTSELSWSTAGAELDSNFAI